MLDFNSCIKVGIADYKIASSPSKLVTLGLGSCVGICIFDTEKKIGGLAHILLPEKKEYTIKNKADLKCADAAIPAMIDEMQSLGCNIKDCRAVIVGGGNMFTCETKDITLSVGYKNQEAVRKVLNSYRIPIVCDETGGNVGKTVFFDTENGDVYVKIGMDISKIYKGFKKCK